MKEVRIVLVHDLYTDYNDNESQAVIRDSVSDWEQITDEEYRLLKDNWWRLAHHLGNHDNGRPILLEKDRVPVRQRISSIREWVQQEQEKIQAEKAAKQAQAEERARKKLLKNAESERKLLEELKKKYPDA
jgi:Trm5-related predicted tRNA methylase